jgi:pimeloyl-ACP methyl ester carboxylesterase
MRDLGKTPPFRAPDGGVMLGSIAEIAYRRLGGVDQWVMIRGESAANPPLILLHGGPGLSETAFFRRFNAPLEKSFTVVYWDQRAAGKSFDRNIPRSSMTVEQFISDLDDLVDAVCKRLGATKVAIFGHSWGSALGVLYAARFPQKCVRARRGEAPRQAQGGKEVARDRPPASHSQAIVDGAHLGDAPRGRHAPKGSVERGASRTHRPGIVDFRSAEHHARLSILA